MLTNSIITDNTQTNNGAGGLYSDSTQTTIDNCNISNNKTGDHGGGIAIWDGGLLITNSTLNNNVSDYCGGGISFYDPLGVTISNCSINSNTAGDWGGGIQLENPDAVNVVIRNNIFSQNMLFQISDEASGANLTVDHNLIHDYTGAY